ncbi:MAG: FkbM family methyltransferase [Flavobacteriales bacterium]|nr:FkbM family methyltransferase [Flavobacteriales bacterium]
MTTLDSYGLHACDLIKIDAEGLEFSILQGAWQTIAKA